MGLSARDRDEFTLAGRPAARAYGHVLLGIARKGAIRVPGGTLDRAGFAEVSQDGLEVLGRDALRLITHRPGLGWVATIAASFR